MTNKVIETWIRFGPIDRTRGASYVIQKFKGRMLPAIAKRRAEGNVLPDYPNVAIRDIVWIGANGRVKKVWKAPRPEKEKSP